MEVGHHVVCTFVHTSYLCVYGVWCGVCCVCVCVCVCAHVCVGVHVCVCVEGREIMPFTILENSISDPFVVWHVSSQSQNRLTDHKSYMYIHVLSRAIVYYIKETCFIRLLKIQRTKI